MHSLGLMTYRIQARILLLSTQRVFHTLLVTSINQWLADLTVNGGPPISPHPRAYKLVSAHYHTMALPYTTTHSRGTFLPFSRLRNSGIRPPHPVFTPL